MKRQLLGFGVLLFLFIAASSLSAQDATPEATTEATVEAPQTLSDIFASLPQSRAEDGGFVVGEPTAPITIVEFSDYACPHCEEYRPVIDRVIMDFVATGQAKYELRILPTAGGQLTYVVGRLVECAEQQTAGSFWAAYEILYGYVTTRQYDENIARTMAKDFHLDYPKLLLCAREVSQVDTDMALAQQFGVHGTPAVMVRMGNGDPQFITLDGRTYNSGGVPYEVLAQVIAAANGAEATPEPTAEPVVIQALNRS